MQQLYLRDVVTTKLVVLDPDVGAAVAATYITDKETVAILETGGKWGYISADHLNRSGTRAWQLASFDVVIKPASMLSATLEQLPADLMKGAVLFEADGQFMAFSTPKLLFAALLSRHKLQQSQMEAILDTVGESVCVIDKANQVVIWNKGAERLYGIQAEEILGKVIDSFFSNLLVKKAASERITIKDQYHNPCSKTHVLINAAPIIMNYQVVGGVCAERDITEIVNLNQELTRTSRKVESLEKEIDEISANADAFAAICGHSPAIIVAVSMARRVAATSAPLLLRGESGTGKEVFARAVHTASNRKGRFIEINCGGIPANLIESELFGYQSGAFTGADRRGKAGLFELANGGTLFLDEIGEMPREMQVKLLRVLQEKKFYRVGGDSPIQVDVRIIAATHRELEKMIERGEFREDLYYRLNVVTIHLPPLRDRREDIPELVYRGLKHFSRIHNPAVVNSKVEPDLMVALLEYDWPGNVRELNNVLERMVILADGDILTSDYLPANIKTRSSPNKPVCSVSPITVTTLSELMTLERELIEQTLQENNFNKAAAAKKLGIPRSTLYYKMQQLNLTTGGVSLLTSASKD